MISKMYYLHIDSHMNCFVILKARLIILTFLGGVPSFIFTLLKSKKYDRYYISISYILLDL